MDHDSGMTHDAARLTHDCMSRNRPASVQHVSIMSHMSHTPWHVGYDNMHIQMSDDA